MLDNSVIQPGELFARKKQKQLTLQDLTQWGDSYLAYFTLSELCCSWVESVLARCQQLVFSNFSSSRLGHVAGSGLPGIWGDDLRKIILEITRRKVF